MGHTAHREREGPQLGRHSRKDAADHSAVQRACEARACETAARSPHDEMARGANSELNSGRQLSVRKRLGADLGDNKLRRRKCFFQFGMCVALKTRSYCRTNGE